MRISAFVRPRDPNPSSDTESDPEAPQGAADLQPWRSLALTLARKLISRVVRADENVEPKEVDRDAVLAKGASELAANFGMRLEPAIVPAVSPYDGNMSQVQPGSLPRGSLLCRAWVRGVPFPWW